MDDRATLRHAAAAALGEQLGVAYRVFLADPRRTSDDPDVEREARRDWQRARAVAQVEYEERMRALREDNTQAVCQVCNRRVDAERRRQRSTAGDVRPVLVILAHRDQGRRCPGSLHILHSTEPVAP
jgi:hypothetical protein